MSDRVLVFMLAGERFALPVSATLECLPLPLLWRRPGLPPHVAGFLSLGDVAVPVLDLARLLGLRDADATPALEADGLYRHLVRLEQAALLVDRVLELAPRLPAPADPQADAWQHGCIRERLLVSGEPVALLDPARILRDDERRRLALLTDAAIRRDALWQQHDAVGSQVADDAA